MTRERMPRAGQPGTAISLPTIPDMTAQNRGQPENAQDWHRESLAAGPQAAGPPGMAGIYRQLGPRQAGGSRELVTAKPWPSAK